MYIRNKYECSDFFMTSGVYRLNGHLNNGVSVIAIPQAVNKIALEWISGVTCYNTLWAVGWVVVLFGLLITGMVNACGVRTPSRVVVLMCGRVLTPPSSVTVW